MRMRTRLSGYVAVGAAAMLALTLGACGSDDGGGGERSQGFADCEENPNTCNSGDRQDGGEILWVIEDAPDTYFPWSAEGGSVYTLQAVSGILPFTGQFQPDGAYAYNMDLLAEEPQITGEAPFQTTWKIAEDAVWMDGTQITAEDFIITWMMSTREEEGYCTGCAPRSFSELFASVEGSDNGKTVTITYKEGKNDPEWFATFSAHGIVGGVVPAHIAKAQGFISGGPDEWDPAGLGEYFTYLDTNPATFSGGPYMIESFDLDNQVVKVPNPNWYGEVQPTLDKLIIKFLTDESTWVPALQNGEMHGASPANWAPDVIRALQGMDNVRLNIQAGPSWEHIEFNMENQWFANYPALRKAIFTVVDAQDWATRVYGDIYPEISTLGNMIHKPNSQYYRNLLEGTGQGSGDVEAARQILADAGFTGMDGGAGELTFEGEQVGPFRLRTTTPPARVTGQLLLQGYLAQIGIQGDIEPTDDLGGTLVSADYDIMQFGWSGAPLFVGTAKQFWGSDSGSNFGHYSNDQVDALIEQAESAATLDESAQIQGQAQEIVVSEAYSLPLFNTPVFIFVTDDYVGIRDNTSSSLRGVYSTGGWGLAVS